MSFLTSVIAWLVRKFGLKVVLLGLQKTIQALMIAVFLAAFYFFLKVADTFYGLISDFVSKFNNFSASATVYGNDFASIFFGIMQSSGVMTAFVFLMNLYIMVLLLLLSKYLYNVFVKVTEQIYKFIDDTIKLLAA